MMNFMLSRYIHEAMLRARYKVLPDKTYFGEIPGVTGVWANERALDKCREVLQEVLEEWLILKIRDHDAIPRMGRIGLPVKAA
jgi:predicted RNase H-like HicB family nuclease